MDDNLLNTGFDPNRRELCPDGACVGVIGPDGRCKECGAESPNGPPAEPEVVGTPPPEEETADASAPEPSPARETEPETDGFDPNRRQLCSDGACIGVIGPDGRCKECGKPLE